MAASSKISTTQERILRKRQAARVRQQRCRARKRQALLLLERQEEKKKKNISREVEQHADIRNEAIPRSAENNNIQKDLSYEIEQQQQHHHSPRSSAFWNGPALTNNGSCWDSISSRKSDFPPRGYNNNNPSFEPKRGLYGPALNQHRVRMPCSFIHKPSPPPLLFRRRRQHPNPASNNPFIISIKHQPARFYESQQYRVPAGPCRQGCWSTVSSPPKIPMLKKSDMVVDPTTTPHNNGSIVLESNEEAAVDAILSLKTSAAQSTTTIVSSSAEEPTTSSISAFQEYRAGISTERKRPIHPGFYLTLRV